MRRDEQRGRVGRWLRAQRLERGYSTQDAAISALASWGWPVSRSVYAEWESGSRVPSDENLSRLEEFYGRRVIEAAPVTDQSALVAAIDRQTAAIERQGDALIAVLRGQDQIVAALLALAEELGVTTDAETARLRIAADRTRRRKRAPGAPRPALEDEPADATRDPATTALPPPGAGPSGTRPEPPAPDRHASGVGR